MTHDKFINSYISSVKDEIQKLKDDMSRAVFTDLYSVGKIQGRIDGLKSSLQILEEAYAEQDV